MENRIIFKKTDSLGRFCIPKVVRENWELTGLDLLNVSADELGIHIKKEYQVNGIYKNTAYSRSIDTLGRVIIPHKIREKFGIEPNAYLEVEVTDEEILILPPRKCALCGNKEALTPFMDKYICHDCITGLKAKIGA